MSQEIKQIAISIITLAISRCIERETTYINGIVAGITGEVDQILMGMMNTCQKGGLEDVYAWLLSVVKAKMGH